mmetsp:Transcript_16004/g.48588  ORF Transcript_16004/g.48588 Transcript_16004/m.48588 type:complete len:277 (+) Transcript_16004:967-1797(+)
MVKGVVSRTSRLSLHWPLAPRQCPPCDAASKSPCLRYEPPLQSAARTAHPRIRSLDMLRWWQRPRRRYSHDRGPLAGFQYAASLRTWQSRSLHGACRPCLSMSLTCSRPWAGRARHAMRTAAGAWAAVGAQQGTTRCPGSAICIEEAQRSHARSQDIEAGHIGERGLRGPQVVAATTEAPAPPRRRSLVVPQPRMQARMDGHRSYSRHLPALARAPSLMGDGSQLKVPKGVTAVASSGVRSPARGSGEFSESLGDERSNWRYRHDVPVGARVLAAA